MSNDLPNRDGEAGQAVLETALILPIIFGLLFAIVEFGTVFHHWNDQNDMANQAARYAAVGRNPGGAGQDLATYIKAQADTEDLKRASGGATVCIKMSAASATPAKVGDPVNVTVKYSYNFLGFISSRAAKVSTTITGRADMRIERTNPTPVDPGVPTSGTQSAGGTCP